MKTIYLSGMVFLMVISFSKPCFSVLTKEDIQEIRKVVREEIEPRFASVNQRIGDVNQRINDMQKQFYFLYILLAAIIALIGVMVNAVIKFTKEERPIGERQYNQILTREVRRRHKQT